jgi:uncharacterized membrane protein
MRIAGHPLHMMLVHFPAALLPMEFVSSCLYHYTGITAYSFVALCAMTGGIAGGWLAVFSGISEISFVQKTKPAALNKVLIHSCLNSLVIIAYSLLLYYQYKKLPVPDADSILMLLFKCILLIVMFTGNYLGGNLILKYKIAAACD